MLRRLTGLIGTVTSNHRLEWVVVATVVVLLALAVLFGWVRVLPERP
jgi:hypothetical protein